MTRIPLIAGNWKMNLDHEEGTNHFQALAEGIAHAGHTTSDVEVVVFPPFTDLRSIQVFAGGEKTDLMYGAQDLSPEDKGAFTGDVSGAFLAKLGCSYALVGHSERRTLHGETDEQVRLKTVAALRHGLVPMVCVGEGLEVRQAGKHVEHTLEQVRGALEGLSAEEAAQVVVAYEPVWAIGTGEVATAGDAQEMAAAIRQELEELFDGSVAQAVRVLYGGSVKGSNAAEIIGQDDVDGALVGGASLQADEFLKIIAR